MISSANIKYALDLIGCYNEFYFHYVSSMISEISLFLLFIYVGLMETPSNCFSRDLYIVYFILLLVCFVTLASLISY
jgi:hypothetical protein